jgi:DNA polymerase-3 subunit epsilon
MKPPPDRHRAPADVAVTAQVFFRLVRAADDDPQFSDLAALVKLAGRTARCNKPVQGGLFDIEPSGESDVGKPA